MNSEQQFYQSLPRKIIGAGALFRVGEKWLIVKPTYKDGWSIPGGTVDPEEAPSQACRREVREELGLDCGPLTLIAIDYVETLGVRPEMIHFLFFGGELSHEQIKQIVLPRDELSEFRLVALDEALALLRPGLATRIPFALRALDAGRICYLERGRPI